MKAMKTILMLILALVAVSFVSAASDYSVKYVEFDGVTVEQTGNAFKVDRGTTLPVTVVLNGATPGNVAYDTRVRVELGGYEYGTVEAVSDIFEVVPGQTQKIHLNLKLPYDMEASKTYSVKVEVYDDNQHIVQTYPLAVKEVRHLLGIYDVIMNPFDNVVAGQPLFVTVRVENMGDNVEDSIKVTASIPALGVQASEFVDELVRTRDQDRYTDTVVKNDAATSNQLMLMVPEDAKSGEYEVKVVLTYNRGYGHDGFDGIVADSKTYKFNVKGAKPTVVTQPSLVVNVDNSNQNVVAGQGAVYKVSVANLGKDALFTVELNGVSDWSTSRVDPQALVIGADKTADVNVYVSPSENVAGLRSFTVKVKDASGNVVAEKALTVNVAAQNSVDFGSVKKVLEFGFVALLIVLVILGIVLVAKRLGGKEESIEGQTYYQ